MPHTVMDLILKIEGMRDQALILRSMVETNRDSSHIKHSLEQIVDMARQISYIQIDPNIDVGKK